MATLKEAVESGRLWRHLHKEYPLGHSDWFGPGPRTSAERRWATDEALSNDFEIEPVLFNEQRFPCGHPDWCACNPSQKMKEPEPEKPREWWLNTLTHAVCVADNSHIHEGSSSWHRVHDAEECERIRGKHGR